MKLRVLCVLIVAGRRLGQGSSFEKQTIVINMYCLYSVIVICVFRAESSTLSARKNMLPHERSEGGNFLRVTKILSAGKTHKIFPPTTINLEQILHFTMELFYFKFRHLHLQHNPHQTNFKCKFQTYFNC